MSTTDLDLIKCDLCKRCYNIDVYQRHRNKNQCIKRNHHRLPFESIKQRSIQIGDKIFSVQQQQKNIDGQMPKSREKRKQQQQLATNNNNKQCQQKHQRILPSNSRRRILEQARQLLERRTKYKPPRVHIRTSFAKDASHKAVEQGISPLPTTKFKKDNLPIKISDRHRHNLKLSQLPNVTHSPKTRASQVLSTSKNPQHRIDRTLASEQTNSTSRLTRKAYTWTRSSKQSINRDSISPIHIPTFYESSSSLFHNPSILLSNQNYDDDEFERFSPTPPSTPKYHQDQNILPNLKPNFILNEQQTMIRPNTYHKAKRSDRPQYETVIQSSSPRKNPSSTFHLPPINPSPYSKLKHHPKQNPRPWR